MTCKHPWHLMELICIPRLNCSTMPSCWCRAPRNKDPCMWLQPASPDLVQTQPYNHEPCAPWPLQFTVSLRSTLKTFSSPFGSLGSSTNTMHSDNCLHAHLMVGMVKITTPPRQSKIDYKVLLHDWCSTVYLHPRIQTCWLCQFQILSL